MKIGRAFIYLFLTVISFICVFPFIWMLIGATNNSLDILSGKLTPGGYLIENMITLFQKYDMGLVLWNSVKISVISVLLILLVTSMAAYGFQMFASEWKERIYGFFILTMMIPFATLMIPLFQIIVQFGLVNSHFAIIIVSTASVFMIFFFRQSFVTYPLEVLQAARVDGANEMTIYFKIFVPSVKSTFFAAAIYSFITSWNSYMWPLIVLQTNEQRTTTLLISALSSSYTPEYGVIMLAIVIATLPVIIVFFAFQKQFVQGMMGSVKG